MRQRDGNRRIGPVIVLALSLSLGGCLFSQPVIEGQDTGPRIGTRFVRGFVMPERALEQVQVGSSREQVQFVLGTPSTIATLDGEVFYYISQTVSREPFQMDRVIDQRVLAVYFGGDSRVTRIANWGLEDGRVFDFIARTTPSGGTEPTLLAQIFRNATSATPNVFGAGGSAPGGAGGIPR